MRIIKDINKLKPNASFACKLFMEECRKQGLNVAVTETLRTAQRQGELYAIGRTKPGKIVTWTKKSRHQSGLAWDICKNVKGEEYSDTGFFQACGQVAKKLGIIWGGNWKNKDMPHFEVAKNWGDREMQEIDKLKQELNEIKNIIKVYRYTADVPEWARKTVQKLIDKGIYMGVAEDNLNLSEDIMRIMVILDRAGVFDR